MNFGTSALGIVHVASDSLLVSPLGATNDFYKHSSTKGGDFLCMLARDPSQLMNNTTRKLKVYQQTKHAVLILTLLSDS